MDYSVVSDLTDLMVEAEWQRVVHALAAVGIDPTDAGRFASGRHPEVIRQPRFDFDAAVPVLVDWLPRVTTKPVKEAVVRSLSVPAARPLAQLPLIRAFEREPDPLVKWTIGNALDVVADEKLRPELVRLAQDARHGKGRQMIVHRLGRGRRDGQVADLLSRLCEDDDVALHAMSGLQRQVGRAAAQERIGPLLDHPSPQIRQAAKIQMRKIRSAERRAKRS